MPSFTLFKPTSQQGALYGAGIAGVALLVAIIMLYKGLNTEPSLSQALPLIGAFLLGGLAAIYGYWTWSCSSLAYVVDRNALTIRWGGLRQIIPLENIERLIPAGGGAAPRIEGVSWPGHHVGRAEVQELGDVLFYTTHRTMDEVLYVETLAQVYAISVPDQVFFAQTVQSNQGRGSLFEQTQTVRRWGIAAQTFWSDQNALILAGVLVLAFFTVLVYVLQGYPDLAQNVPLRFPALGGIVRVSDRSALLDIPRTAAGFMVTNLLLAVVLHSWERMVGYVLLLAGISIQVVLLVAAAVAVA